MTTTADEILDFDLFSLRRYGPDKDQWLVEWKTTGLIETLDTYGNTNTSYIANRLADRLEEMVHLLKENKI